MADFDVGDIIEVEVSGITDYGIFINADNDYKGLIHISEVSIYFVRNLLDYVTIGEHILCEVLDVDNYNKQLKLSIKNINYKLVPRYGKIKDTHDGFKKLQMNLPIWMRKKLNEMDKEKF